MSKFTDLLDDLYAKKYYLIEADYYNLDKEILGVTDISFAAVDSSINSSTTDLSIYDIYDKITVAGSASNDAEYTILTVSAGKITVKETTIVDEAAGADIDLSAVQTLRVTSSTGFITDRDEDLPDIYYDPRLSADVKSLFTRNMYGFRKTFGATDTAYGEVVIANVDGQLDDLRFYSFNGRKVVIKLGGDGFSYSDYGTVFEGTASQASFTFRDLHILIKDKSYILENPVQDVLYDGTNSGSTGNEGTPSDIEGKPKPLCYGEVKNITLIPVNTSALRYQFHSGGTVQSVDAVYDKGVLLTLTTDYTVDLANGIIDLVAKPAGQVTADVKGDATDTGYVDSVAGTVRRILLTHTELTTDDLDEDSFTALDTLNPAPVGIYIPAETTARKVIDELLNSIGAFGSFNRQGKFAVGRFEPPSGTAVNAFDTDEILNMQIVPLDDENSGIPSSQVILGYALNNTVQNANSLAGAVGDDRRAYVELQYRTVTATSDVTKKRDLLSRPIAKNTVLVNESDAQDEADRLLAIYSEKHFLFEFDVKTKALALDINDVIELTYILKNPNGTFKDYKFGLNQTLARITGIVEDPRKNINTITAFI